MFWSEVDIFNGEASIHYFFTTQAVKSPDSQVHRITRTPHAAYLASQWPELSILLSSSTSTILPSKSASYPSCSQVITVG